MFFNPNQTVEISSRHLTHWQQKGVTYFVTFRLNDSVPQSTLRDWKMARDQFLLSHETHLNAEDSKEFRRRFSNKMDEWLDRGLGSCILDDRKISTELATIFKHFNKERYELGEWVIMPNHVHLIVTPYRGHNVPEILHSWKSFSAKRINKLLNRSGKLWQEESFDQIIRNPSHLYRIKEYIKINPEKAGIEVYHASWI